MQKTFRELKNLPDFRLKSRNILRGVLISISLLIFIGVLAELYVDLATISLPIILSIFLASLIPIIFFSKWPDAQWIRHVAIIMPYAFFVLIFLNNPKSYHTMGFWIILVPLIALILLGIKTAFIWFGVILLTFVFNSIYIESFLDGGYQIQVKTLPFIFGHLIFGIGIFAGGVLLYKLLGDSFIAMKNKSDELFALQKEISDKKNQLEQYQKALLNLNRHEVKSSDSMQDLLKTICLSAAKNLKTSRVSIWLIEDRGTKLVRKVLFENNALTEETSILLKNNYPKYFHALLYKPFIMAFDAYKHEDTAEFAEGYLNGVICCEQQFEKRFWSIEDALFIQSLTDFISIGYQNERIKELLREVRRQNHKLIEKSNSIHVMNEELTAMNEELVSLNDQLTSLNQGLEEAVKQRTEKLEIQNMQLTEYAFINSHLLRAPLARVLGLSQLVAFEVTTVADKTLILALQDAAMELDGIVRKISELLYEGHPMSREDVNQLIRDKFTNASNPKLNP